MRGRVALLAAFALGVATIGSIDAQAAENAAGWYALGTKASMAGFVPPPGTYFIDVNMFMRAMRGPRPRWALRSKTSARRRGGST
jgi:hypothetical protein